MADNPNTAPLPVDGIVYYQSDGEPWMQGYQQSSFGSGTQIDNSGWYCVYNGPTSDLRGGGVQVFGGLDPGKIYGVMAVTYNGSGTGPGTTTYLTDYAVGNPVLLQPDNSTMSFTPRGVPAASPSVLLALGILLCGAGLRRISTKGG